MYESVGRILYMILGPLWKPMAKKSTRVRVVVEYKNEIIIVRNWFGSGRWTLPGGGIAKNESPEEAAQREIYEELGIKADVSDFKQLKIISDNEIADYKIVGLKVTIHSRDFIRNKKELVAVQWANPQQLPPNSNPVISKLTS